MVDEMSPTFVSTAADVIADTAKGLSGPQFVKVTSAYGGRWNVSVPHPTYPFASGVSNKRTALYENLMAFTDTQRFQIIRELCDHPTLVEKNRRGAEALKMTLLAQYAHLASGAQPELDAGLVARTKHFLAPFPDALKQYEKALLKHASRVFLRNLLDDLRLALELLLKGIFSNNKSLENQIAALGVFIKGHGGSTELSNMFVKLVDYYAKYQNSYVKHNDAVIEEEVEFVFELTASFMKHLVRMSQR